jgi:hypothetical protein
MRVKMPLVGRRRITATRAAIVAGAIGLLFSAAPKLAAQAATPLTVAELLELQRQGVSSSQILRNATSYCIAFVMTDSVARVLTSAGADSTLVVGLRTVCNAKDQASPPAPSTADLVIEDAFRARGRVARLLWSDPTCSIKADSSGLHIENKKRETDCVIAYPSDPLEPLIRIEVEYTALRGGDQSVLLFGFGRNQSAPGEYSLSVRADRRMELCYREGSSCRRLVSKPSIPSLHAEADSLNRIAVEIHGREITLLANDVAVGNYRGKTDVTGTLNLGAGPNTTVIVTHIQARRLPPTTAGR